MRHGEVKVDNSQPDCWIVGHVVAVQGPFPVTCYDGGAFCKPFEGDYLVGFVRGGKLFRYLLFDELFNVL